MFPIVLGLACEASSSCRRSRSRAVSCDKFSNLGNCSGGVDEQPWQACGGGMKIRRPRMVQRKRCSNLEGLWLQMAFGTPKTLARLGGQAWASCATPAAKLSAWPMTAQQWCAAGLMNEVFPNFCMISIKNTSGNSCDNCSSIVVRPSAALGNIGDFSI